MFTALFTKADRIQSVSSHVALRSSLIFSCMSTTAEHRFPFGHPHYYFVCVAHLILVHSTVMITRSTVEITQFSSAPCSLFSLGPHYGRAQGVIHRLLTETPGFTSRGVHVGFVADGGTLGYVLRPDRMGSGTGNILGSNFVRAARSSWYPPAPSGSCWDSTSIMSQIYHS
jgi:hypothetical protein